MQKSIIRKGLLVGIIILITGISVIPCISGNINKEFSFSKSNNPPYEPSNPNPEDGAIFVVPISINLSWTGGDPDPGDIVRYDLYFDDVFPPALKSEGQRETYWNIPYQFTKNNTYYWKIVSWDNHGASTTGPVWQFSTVLSHPPSAPTIQGPNGGTVGRRYSYKLTAEDPDGDNVSYFIEWGDGTSEGWTDYRSSGLPISLNHVWYTPDYFEIHCKAKDVYGAEGNWSEVEILITKNKASNQNFNLLEKSTQKSENKEILESPVIIVHVTEMYGTPSNPRYKPLPNVTVKIRDHILWWNLVWSGKTNEKGRTEDVEIITGFLYRVSVSKKNYREYKGDGWTVVGTYVIQECHVYFTMVDKDGPFAQQTTQQSLNPLLLRFLERFPNVLMRRII